jgi:hypothetical protein
MQRKGKEVVMRKNRKERETVNRRATLLSGLLIGAMAFSAGVAARSHKSVEPGRTEVVRTETETSVQTVEPRWIAPSDQGKVDRRLPGHSELDLQLD